jgi:hypothetical protein
MTKTQETHFFTQGQPPSYIRVTESIKAAKKIESDPSRNHARLLGAGLAQSLKVKCAQNLAALLSR